MFPRLKNSHIGRFAGERCGSFPDHAHGRFLRQITFVTSSGTEGVFREPTTYDRVDMMEKDMRNRKQRRQKAILPLKVFVGVGSKTHLGHTLDISASGARIVLAAKIAPGTPISLEFKHRRTTGTAVWCAPLRESKYDHVLGVCLPTAGTSFWGIQLPMNETDRTEEAAAIPFSQFMESLSKEA